MKLEYIRASQISTYLECSAKFLFQNIQRIRTPNKPALAFGTAVHKTLETNFKQKVVTRQDISVENALDIFSDSITALIGDIDKTDLVGIDTPANLKDAGINLIRKYQTEHSYRIFPKQVETTVLAKFEGYPFGLSGTIDLLDEDNVLIDHKTTAKPPLNVAEGYKLQLGGAYAVLMEVKLSEPIRYARIDYLIRGKRSEIKPIAIQTDPSYFMRIFGTVSEGVEKQIFLPNREHHFCTKRWCKFWEVCEKEFGGTVKQ